MPTSKPEDWYVLPTNFARTSSGASILGLRPEITSKLQAIQRVFQRCLGRMDYRIAITGGQEWSPKHGLFSLHHTGFAVDIRSRDLPGGGTGPMAQKITVELQKELGPEYYVLLHRPPDPPHIHVQLSKGIRMSSPGDWPDPRPGRA